MRCSSPWRGLLVWTSLQQRLRSSLRSLSSCVMAQTSSSRYHHPLRPSQSTRSSPHSALYCSTRTCARDWHLPLQPSSGLRARRSGNWSRPSHHRHHQRCLLDVDADRCRARRRGRGRRDVVDAVAHRRCRRRRRHRRWRCFDDLEVLHHRRHRRHCDVELALKGLELQVHHRLRRLLRHRRIHPRPRHHPAV